ncbi:hypothetical protein J1605_008938, partial [Eschrichtius robustus]
VEKLVKYLDPNDLGRINFKDFCRGVFAMKGCEELLKDVLAVESAGTLPCALEIPDCVEQLGVQQSNPLLTLTAQRWCRPQGQSLSPAWEQPQTGHPGYLHFCWGQLQMRGSRNPPQVP